MEIILGLAIAATSFWALFCYTEECLKSAILLLGLGSVLIMSLISYLVFVPVVEHDTAEVITTRLSISVAGSNLNEPIVTFPTPTRIQLSTSKRWGSAYGTVVFRVMEPK
jgi:hypothetical protein